MSEPSGEEEEEDSRAWDPDYRPSQDVEDGESDHSAGDRIRRKPTPEKLPGNCYSHPQQRKSTIGAKTPISF